MGIQYIMITSIGNYVVGFHYSMILITSYLIEFKWSYYIFFPQTINISLLQF